MQNIYNKDRDVDNGSKDRLTDLNATLKQGEERIKSTISDVEKRITQGKEQLKNVISGVDKKLHENPWPIVAGVAVGCILLGFILGFKRR